MAFPILNLLKGKGRGYIFYKILIRLGMVYLMRASSAKVERYKSQPDDASSIHGKTNKLSLIKVFRYFSSFDSIYCAHCDQEHAVKLKRKK